MAIKIRPFEEPDRGALREIFLASRRQGFPWEQPDRLQLTDFDAATEGESILVAVDEIDPVGFVSWWPPENFVHNLFVFPDYWREGVGSLLLSGCLEQIGRPARLKCVQRNASAIAFYEKRGWKVESQGDGPDGPYFQMVLI